MAPEPGGNRLGARSPITTRSTWLLGGDPVDDVFDGAADGELPNRQPFARDLAGKHLQFSPRALDAPVLIEIEEGLPLLESRHWRHGVQQRQGEIPA